MIQSSSQPGQAVTAAANFLWDNAGLQVGVLNGAGKALTYTLDPTGKRTVLLDSDGGLTSYSYDQQDRLTGVINPFNVITAITLDAPDRESQKACGDGLKAQRNYDAAGRETVLSQRDCGRSGSLLVCVDAPRRGKPSVEERLGNNKKAGWKPCTDVCETEVVPRLYPGY